jgi:hypothetical protein
MKILRQNATEAAVTLEKIPSRAPDLCFLREEGNLKTNPELICFLN